MSNATTPPHRSLASLPRELRQKILLFATHAELGYSRRYQNRTALEEARRAVFSWAAMNRRMREDASYALRLRLGEWLMMLD